VKSDLKQDCQTFFVAYGQNLNKKWPKWLFFENVMAKNAKWLSYIITGDTKYLEGSVFFAEKIWLCRKTSFDLKTAISAMNLKLCVTTAFILVKLPNILNSTVDKCFN